MNFLRYSVLFAAMAAFGADSAAPSVGKIFDHELTSAENEIVVSVASIWELSIKQRLGKLVVPGSFQGFIQDALRETQVLGISRLHVERLHTLPAFHRDPFDRIIVAQALAEDLVLATVDKALAGYGAPLLPA